MGKKDVYDVVNLRTASPGRWVALRLQYRILKNTNAKYARACTNKLFISHERLHALSMAWRQPHDAIRYAIQNVPVRT